MNNGLLTVMYMDLDRLELILTTRALLTSSTGSRVSYHESCVCKDVSGCVQAHKYLIHQLISKMFYDGDLHGSILSGFMNRWTALVNTRVELVGNNIKRFYVIKV